MRLFPAVALDWLGAGVVIFVEVTGAVIPAVLLFAIASGKIKRPRDQRAVRLLLLVCGLYFVRCGLWMVRPAVSDLNTARYEDGICRQSTDYTCVAASLVTLLRTYGIPATETEMARLSYTEVNNGATDSRGVYALQRKLASLPIEVRYERGMTYDRLLELGRPCVAPIKWGYFTSHMVPVLEVNEQTVKLGDPLTGPRELSRAEFESEWLRRAMYLVDGRPRPAMRETDGSRPADGCGNTRGTGTRGQVTNDDGPRLHTGPAPDTTAGDHGGTDAQVCKVVHADTPGEAHGGPQENALPQHIVMVGDRAGTQNAVRPDARVDTDGDARTDDRMARDLGAR